MDISLALMTGVDIVLPELKVVLHQPSLKEISFIGEKEFLTGIQTLSVSKTMFIQDKTLLSSTNNFQVFMAVINESLMVDKKKSVIQVLSLFFPNYQAVITPRAISLFGDGDETALLDESNFEQFQEILAQVCCLKTSDDSFNPQGDKAKEIADKLMRARQRVAAQKAKTAENSSVFAQYISTLTVGVGSMSLNDCINLTIYQLYDLVERYSLYINWDIDLRSRLAGAKIDKPVDNWMKNIH